jgi:23S rRNA (uracil1939-C5)-methyltransferase
MDALTKNSLHSVKIEGYSADGSGVSRIDGQVVFIKGALRGETCEIKIVKALKNMAYAIIEHIIEASPHRIAPSCSAFGRCGGCDFLHMDYEEELSLKRQRVDEALCRIGGLDLGVSDMHGAPEIEGYRNKAIYAVGTKYGKALTGFFRERSHDIVPVNRCLIQTEASDKAAAALCRWIDKFGISVYDEATGKGLIRHLFVRTAFGTKQMSVCLVAAASNLPYTEELVSEVLSACPETASIVLSLNKKPGNTVLGEKFKTLWGQDHIEETLCGLKFKLSPKSFFQINPVQAENLYTKALDFAAADKSSTALDLYCGTGTISLVLAKKAGQVIGVEAVAAAVSDARENAEVNNMKNVEFICADAAEAAKELKKRGVTPSVIVVDPPRKGLTPELIETITAMSPERVVYVSCDPATLARDLKHFATLGYNAERAEAFDMFPRTAHVESIVLMTK